MSTQLTIELVPSTAWFKNVRSEITSQQWDDLRKSCYKAAHWRCEVCGGKGKQHPVECHEVWSYDDVTYVQKLERLISLCPPCHSVKHIGYAEISGRYMAAFQHLMKVNRWSETDAQEYVNASFELWARRSRHMWTLDLTFLHQFGIFPKPPKDWAATPTQALPKDEISTGWESLDPFERI